jgi:two-component system LytT family sensor kinase
MNKVKHFGESILQFAGSRVALNIYFWIFLFALKHIDVDDQHAYPKLFYYCIMIFYMSFFAILSYVNNLILLPKFLFKQKQLLYFISAVTLIFIIAFTYTFFITWLPIVFPGLDSLQMSIIMSPVNNDISFLGILTNIDTYLSMMAVWTVIFTLLGYYHHSVKEKKRLEALVNKHRETELAFIKNQMNPHFLFNTLNNLYALAIKKSDETPEVILQLSAILRYILYESDIELVSFEKEKEIIQAYIDIELLRVPQTPEIQFSIMADKSYQIPPLLWLPALENIFKHSRSVDKLEIDFRLSIQQNEMHLYCKNNFKKPNTTNEKQAGGLGLVNLEKRLSWLYPNKHKLTTTVHENYFIIDMHIQLS